MDERRPLPESVGALFATALRAYASRLRLYLGAACAGILLESAIAYLRPGDTGFFSAGVVAVDAFLAALVTLGVIADLRAGERVANRDLLAHSLARWGIVAAVTTIVYIINVATSSSVFGPPDATAYGLLILPIVVLWGSISFASVIAATDEKSPQALLVIASIGRSMNLALAWPNLGRLTLLALISVLPALVETILADQLALRKVAAAQFIGNVPLDALVTGPLQALFTVFYLDFVRRSSAPRRR